ncbi:unnamed protein product [Ceutorhynchus assimilis]|uniref:Uncharacterized protein n=1 Tax=Ceutorhynchus assimilis TaxID=467358 RepID=A0A9P0DDQ9_9CUCU|nr:unnamed protein product [Ceutorhynchus assimilis]
MLRFIILCILLFTNNCSASDKFSFCKLGDGNFDDCLAKSIQTALRAIKSGYPEYGLKKFDPLFAGNFTIKGGTGPVQLDQYHIDVEILGFSNLTVIKAHFDDKKKSLQISTKLTRMIQQGNYVVDGKILALPVVGNGKCTFWIDELDFPVTMDFQETKKDDKTYFKITSFRVGIHMKKMQMNFENLFNGNKLLGDNINRVINENWDALFSDVRTSTEECYAGFLKRYAQDFFDKVPVDEIFLK